MYIAKGAQKLDKADLFIRAPHRYMIMTAFATTGFDPKGLDEHDSGGRLRNNLHAEGGGLGIQRAGGGSGVIEKLDGLQAMSSKEIASAIYFLVVCSRHCTR